MDMLTSTFAMDNLSMDPDINDPYAWELPMIARLRYEGLIPASVPPPPPPGAQFRSLPAYRQPVDVVDALQYSVRGVRLAIICETNTFGNKHIISARVAVHYIHEALMQQLKALEDDEIALDLARTSTDLLHQMYNYVAPRVGMGLSSVRPPSPGDRPIEDIIAELSSMVPNFKESIALKISEKEAAKQFEFIAEHPVFGMFPMEMAYDS